MSLLGFNEVLLQHVPDPCFDVELGVEVHTLGHELREDVSIDNCSTDCLCTGCDMPFFFPMFGVFLP